MTTDAAAQSTPAAPPLATIQTYPDGPLIVRGAFALEDHLGGSIPNERRTVALCRCGRSAIKPFCDGAHKRRQPSAAPDRRSDDAATIEPNEPT
jgi:CDGSH-type Zn-finger protein